MINLRASVEGYVFEVVKVNRQNRNLVARLKITERGFEFASLADMPTLVIKGNPITLGDMVITPTKTRTIKRAEQLEWLKENGAEYEPVMDAFLPLGSSLPVNFKADKVSASCLGIPKINARMTIGSEKQKQTLKIANGYIADSGYFYGFINYEAS